MSQRNGGVKTRAFKAAFPRVLPICISFFFLAMSYGVLMGTRGFSFLWPLCMSAFIYTCLLYTSDAADDEHLV